MPTNESPPAIFIGNSQSDESLLEFAKNIISKTHGVFIRGSGNRMMDLRQNPNAYHELEYSRAQPMPLDIFDPTLFKLTELLDQKDGSRFMNMLNQLLQAYTNGIGNCGEMAVVGLYFITTAPCELLHTATLVSLKPADHCFIKLEFTNNTAIFIDPWYKTHEYHGAIFDPSSLDIYLSNLAPILRTSQLIKLVGPFYPARHFIGAAMLALCIYDLQLSLLIIGGISIIPLFLLMVNVMENFLYTPEIIEKLKLSNNHDQSTFDFELFKKICDHNLEKIGKNPVLFSNNALNLKAETKNLQPFKEEDKLPQYIAKSTVGLAAT